MKNLIKVQKCCYVKPSVEVFELLGDINLLASSPKVRPANPPRVIGLIEDDDDTELEGDIEYPHIQPR